MTCNFFLPKGRWMDIAFLCFTLTLLLFLTSCDDEDDRRSGDDQEYSIVSTLAGTNTAGFVDGVGDQAQFNYPSGMAIDEEGNLYVSDHSNHSIRRITPDGAVITFAGTGEAGESDGHRLSATFNNPYGLAIDSEGSLYVSDVSNHRIRKIAADGTVTTLAGMRQGFSDRKGQLAMFDHPYGVAVDKNGNVYVADSYNNRIRMIAPDGTTTTLAGNGNDGFVDGQGLEAEFYVPIGMAIDQAGNLYVGDEGNSSVRKITSDGRVATLAGSGKFSFADGVGRNAVFNAPGAIAIDSHNNLFVADYLNNCIRKVSPEGEVRKIAGSREKGFADGSPSEAEFYYPFGIVVDHNGAVYVADQFNHRIRKIE